MAAAKLLGLEVVPVLILDGQLESTDSLVMRLVENLQRYVFSCLPILG